MHNIAFGLLKNGCNAAPQMSQKRLSFFVNINLHLRQFLKVGRNMTRMRQTSKSAGYQIGTRLRHRIVVGREEG